MFDNVIFGNKLRENRKSLGLGLKKFSILTEIDYQYLGDIERGERTPSTKLFIKFLNILGVSYSQLMDKPKTEERAFYQNIILDKLSYFDSDEKYIILQTIQEMKESLLKG